MYMCLSLSVRPYVHVRGGRQSVYSSTAFEQRVEVLDFMEIEPKN